MIYPKNDYATQAIMTRCLPATNTKPTRIVAETTSGIRVMFSFHELENCLSPNGYNFLVQRVHCLAAKRLLDKLGWPGDYVCGAWKDGYVFVKKEN